MGYLTGTDFCRVLSPVRRASRLCITAAVDPEYGFCQSAKCARSSVAVLLGVLSRLLRSGEDLRVYLCRRRGDFAPVRGESVKVGVGRNRTG
jgi:hypothetical protein